MTKYYIKGNWDKYWKKHQEKKIFLDRIIARLRFYFGRCYVKQLMKIRKPEGKILEVGCGTAYCSSLIARNKKVKSYAMDYSTNLIGYWKDKKVKYYVGDGFSIPFKDKSFDIVWNAGVLEHFDDPLPFLKEMRRVTKENGLVYVLVPYIFDLTAIFQLYGREEIYNSKTLKKVLKKAGLKGVKTKVLFDCFGFLISGWGKKYTIKE